MGEGRSGGRREDDFEAIVDVDRRFGVSVGPSESLLDFVNSILVGVLVVGEFVIDSRGRGSRALRTKQISVCSHLLTSQLAAARDPLRITARLEAQLLHLAAAISAVVAALSRRASGSRALPGGHAGRRSARARHRLVAGPTSRRGVEHSCEPHFGGG